MGLDDGGEAFERASLSKRLNLNYVKVRPLYARAAKDNIASMRVLEIGLGHGHISDPLAPLLLDAQEPRHPHKLHLRTSSLDALHLAIP